MRFRLHWGSTKIQVVFPGSRFVLGKRNSIPGTISGEGEQGEIIGGNTSKGSSSYSPKGIRSASFSSSESYRRKSTKNRQSKIAKSPASNSKASASVVVAASAASEIKGCLDSCEFRSSKKVHEEQQQQQQQQASRPEIIPDLIISSSKESDGSFVAAETAEAASSEQQRQQQQHPERQQNLQQNSRTNSRKSSFDTIPEHQRQQQQQQLHQPSCDAACSVVYSNHDRFLWGGESSQSSTSPVGVSRGGGGGGRSRASSETKVVPEKPLGHHQDPIPKSLEHLQLESKAVGPIKVRHAIQKLVRRAGLLLSNRLEACSMKKWRLLWKRISQARKRATKFLSNFCLHSRTFNLVFGHLVTWVAW